MDRYIAIGYSLIATSIALKLPLSTLNEHCMYKLQSTTLQQSAHTHTLNIERRPS